MACCATDILQYVEDLQRSNAPGHWIYGPAKRGCTGFDVDSDAQQGMSS
jgi:hypothetical protein